MNVENAENVEMDEKETRNQFSLSLGLDKNEWGSRKIRDSVIELGELLIKYQKLLIPELIKDIGKEKTKELLNKFNVLIEGFRYGKSGRPKMYNDNQNRGDVINE